MLFIRSLEGGGAQRDAILLANALCERGEIVSIITLAADGELKPLVSNAIEIIGLKAKRLATAIPSMRRAIMEHAPRVVFSSETAANAVAFAAVRSLPAKRQPKLLLREVTAPSIAAKRDPYLQNRMAFKLVPWFYPRADRVITLTGGASSDLAVNFGVPANRIAMLGSNAVIDTVTAQRLSTSDWTGRPREPGLIVAIGRLSPEKDHATLIEAMTNLRDHHNAHLVIVGDGPLRSGLAQLIGRLNLSAQVHLAGAQKDPFPWLAKASVVASSSRFEGLGNVLIEALACGTPVVSTDCPYGPREILADGKFGRLVPSGNPGAIAAALNETLELTPDRDALRDRAANYRSCVAADALSRVIETL